MRNQAGHISNSKPKQNKKKTLVVSRKEFVNLQSKVDQILATVTSATPQKTANSTDQSLVDRVQALETREKFYANRMLLQVEVAIRQLDNKEQLIIGNSSQKTKILSIR